MIDTADEDGAFRHSIPLNTGRSTENTRVNVPPTDAPRERSASLYRDDAVTTASRGGLDPAATFSCTELCESHIVAGAEETQTPWPVASDRSPPKLDDRADTIVMLDDPVAAKFTRVLLLTRGLSIEKTIEMEPD